MDYYEKLAKVKEDIKVFYKKRTGEEMHESILEGIGSMIHNVNYYMEEFVIATNMKIRMQIEFAQRPKECGDATFENLKAKVEQYESLKQIQYGKVEIATRILNSFLKEVLNIEDLFLFSEGDCGAVLSWKPAWRTRKEFFINIDFIPWEA
jgi:hypothetical protein